MYDRGSAPYIYVYIVVRVLPVKAMLQLVGATVCSCRMTLCRPRRRKHRGSSDKQSAGFQRGGNANAARGRPGEFAQSATAAVRAVERRAVRDRRRSLDRVWAARSADWH